ncbi:hypothetical protein [Actinoalloteichus hymeniacidonis]|uniref:Uncharacterized protein n=1 Tax=Actinoalloteichus hymeniacidonis TaxID=340345 RepID=A0AAC9HUT1_9PSEU|nr:hypothetical protein [Actinoalloteichus hymeniacidonis]AOS65516.1 hypothetical protein TL08_23680 [Actinoalloteichus hymeniacidonis]MBB5906397.1 hypothetical protein [Actinoalloteichus hymeniacidonis]
MRSFRDPAQWSEWVPAVLLGTPSRSMWVAVSCNRAQGHILVEGHHPARRPSLAALTTGATTEVINALRYRRRRDITVPAIGNGLEDRELLVADPGDESALVTIRNTQSILGRWSVHTHRLPELCWALKHAHGLVSGTESAAAIVPTDLAATIAGGAP